MNYVSCIEKRKIWNKGFVELWDFSKVNSCQEAQEEACALISSVNYDRKIKNPAKHFKRLLTENGGRASEVLEFIPHIIMSNESISSEESNKLGRFGYMLDEDLLTNLRATYNYFGEAALSDFEPQSAKNFVVFKVKIPYMIVDHLRRHGRLSNYFAENWQSNRAKHKIEYFENDKIAVRMSISGNPLIEEKSDKCRPELLNKGEFGLRYVTGWFAGWLQDPMTWQNMFKVRGDKTGTQKEMRELTREMKRLIEKYYGWNNAGKEE